MEQCIWVRNGLINVIRRLIKLFKSIQNAVYVTNVKIGIVNPVFNSSCISVQFSHSYEDLNDLLVRLVFGSSLMNVIKIFLQVTVQRSQKP